MVQGEQEANMRGSGNALRDNISTSKKVTQYITNYSMLQLREI